MNAQSGLLGLPGRALLNFLAYLGQLGQLVADLGHSIFRGSLRLRLIESGLERQRGGILSVGRLSL